MSHATRLSSLETSWAGLVLSSFAASPHGFAVLPGEVDYLSGLSSFLAKASDKAALGIRVAFVLVVTAPLWLGGRFVSFGRLSPEERAAILDRLLNHRVFFVRELCLLLKLIACMAIFRGEGPRTRTGYEPALRAKKALVVLPDRAPPPVSGDFPTDGAVLAVGGVR